MRVPIQLALVTVLLAAACGGEDAPSTRGFEWEFSNELATPGTRGVGAGETMVCAPVTTVTRSLDVSITMVPVPELNADSRVQILVFEYDPNIADAAALCVGGGVFAITESPFVQAVDIPDDMSNLDYYVVAEADANGDGNVIEPCVDYDQHHFGAVEGESVDIVLELHGCSGGS